MRRRVVIVCPNPAPPFAVLDARMLSNSYDVEVVPVGGVPLIDMLWSKIGQADLLLVWFVGRNAVWPIIIAKLRRVPVIAVIGGFEVAWVKELNYGIRPGSLREKILTRLITASSRVLSVSEFSRREALTRFPRCENKFDLVPNAIDTVRFDLPVHESRQGVVSVGAISADTIARKSLKLYVETAAHMPDVKFELVGPATDDVGVEFLQKLPDNLRWVGALYNGALIDRLQRSSVYFQASVYESFCVALAEAMSCGCFPVIANRAALPEVVGLTGTMLDSLTVQSAVEAIRIALRRPESDRAIVRQRIVERYGLSVREARLSRIIGNTISQ